MSNPMKKLANNLKKLANNPKMDKVWWLLVIAAIALIIFAPQIGGYLAIGIVFLGILMWFNIDDKNKKEG